MRLLTYNNASKSIDSKLFIKRKSVHQIGFFTQNKSFVQVCNGRSMLVNPFENSKAAGCGKL